MRLTTRGTARAAPALAKVIPARALPRSGLPPGPKGTLIGGHLHQIGPRRVDFFLHLARTYGPVATFRVGTRRLFLVSDPDLIEQVLVRDAKHYVKHFGARVFKPVLGNGLVTSEGDLWRRQRRLIQPAFLKARVLSYAPIMARLAEDMVARWQPGTVVDIESAFSGLTSAIALKALFGLDEHGDRERLNGPLRLAFELMTGRLNWPVQIPLWMPTAANRQLNRAIAELDSVIDGFIAAGRARGATGSDLLSTLIAAQGDDGSQMDDRQLRDEAMTLYLAGHETTALALAWSWYLIARHPQVEQRLVSEWREVLGGRSPEAADLPALTYTGAVISEAMRLFPPVYAIGREAVRETEVGGYRVKRGYTLLMSSWVSHRDPRHFADPERFAPERWEEGLAGRIPKYAYYPFGGGQRLCIGSHFALMEAAILLAIVGQRYRFTIAADAVIDIKPQITLLPLAGIPAPLMPR